MKNILLGMGVIGLVWLVKTINKPIYEKEYAEFLLRDSLRSIQEDSTAARAVNLQTELPSQGND